MIRGKRSGQIFTFNVMIGCAYRETPKVKIRSLSSSSYSISANAMLYPP
jgi:hypothetical protein